MSEYDINHIFLKFSQMRVVIIGDAMVDTYLWGNVERLSPEAPIPVVSVTKRECRLGGAANVALNVQSLGAVPVMFTVVGMDEMGRKFKDIVCENDMPAHGILTDPDRNTTVKSRIIGKGRHIARVDEESTGYISPQLEQNLLDAVTAELETNRVDVIIFVDYDKGVITPALFREVNKLAKVKSIPVAVDPKKRNFSCYKNVDLFKPNFQEFTEGAKLSLKKGDMDALKHAARKLKKKQNYGLIFITLSELGVFISNGEEEQYFPAAIRHIADVSGAGDTVVSVAGLSLAAKLSCKTMAELSNLAGGLVCELPGVVPVDKNRLILLMRSQNF